jgi:EAL domain-containing protein (putative c-di-GMP-specific phosphodiesterase class I)
VTLLPKDGQTADDLLREADTAMYRAKHAGRNRIAFFEAEMQLEVEGRLGLENDLAQAIGTAQLSMLMQPQFNCDGKPIGAEMLMRWMHPVRGAISPAAFIPVAEASGLILELGDWVVRQGCDALLRLQQADQLVPISINVSPSQFRQRDFVERVRGILAESGAPASQLIFEVTEGLLIDNLDETILRMHELAAMGIRFSIDDFGTGYSSLAYLRKLPLYELKIDRSFVMDTPADAGSTAIVQSILAMAAHLHLHVVAEGVETTEQADFLRAAGCAAMQGYLFARPMQLDAWLQRELQTL